MLQAHQAVMAREQAHLLHREQVLVDGAVGVGEDRGQFVLGGRHLVVLGARRHAERPELLVEFLHELVDRRADGAEVVLVELLALARHRAEQRAARHDEVAAALVVLLGDQEVLLLGTDRGDDALRILAEQRQHAVGLLLNGGHRAQKRRLLVQRLAGIAAKRRGDAQHLVLDERVAGGIPGGVAARLERGAQAAGGEARRIGLALDELLAREAHDGSSVAHRIEEAVVLLGRDARQRLEPMGVVGGALLDGPLLHRVGDDVGHLEIERLSLADGLEQAFVRGRRQTLLHRMLVEDHRSVVFRHVRHTDPPLLVEASIIHPKLEPLYRILHGETLPRAAEGELFLDRFFAIGNMNKPISANEERHPCRRSRKRKRAACGGCGRRACRAQTFFTIRRSLLIVKCLLQE